MLVQFNWCIFFSLSSLALFVYNILSSAKYVVCNSMHKHKISLYNLIVILAHLMMPDHLRYYQTYSFDMKILNNMNYLHFHFIYICWLSTRLWDLSPHRKDPKSPLLFRSNVEIDSFGFSFDQKSTINLSIFFSLFHFIWLIFECKFLIVWTHSLCSLCFFFRHTKLSLDTSDISAYQRSVISLSRLRYSNPLISGVVIFVHFWFGKRLSNFWQMKWNMPRKSVSDQNHAIEKIVLCKSSARFWLLKVWQLVKHSQRANDDE